MIMFPSKRWPLRVQNHGVPRPSKPAGEWKLEHDKCPSRARKDRHSAARRGDLSAAPGGKSPTFLVAALKDPIGANLDRIQIVKGWVDQKGDTHEQIYDVAWSDTAKRKIGAKGKLTSVGNTVDVANATWSNTIGASELITVWKDPKFDAKQSAFYYARVIEIPTPRWTAYDAKYYGNKPLSGTAIILQERAYTAQALVLQKEEAGHHQSVTDFADPQGLPDALPGPKLHLYLFPSVGSRLVRQ